MMNKQLNNIVEQVCNIILGKEQAIRLAIACLLARGHLLVEDYPGLGKTTLAQALAGVLGLSFQRIQFTSDMLPADILGVSVYNREEGRFAFHPGPIFSQLVLADEVNRATPKAQSALLEAMEERQVTIEGETRKLPEPFFVIATQNPHHLLGTFPLPESQLDRFLMRLTLGYPDREAEHALLAGKDRRGMLQQLSAVMNTAQLEEMQDNVPRIHASDHLLSYVQALLEYSRSCSDYVIGLSPRAGLALLHAAKAWALMEDRDHVLPEDVQVVLPGVAGHRLQFVDHRQDDGQDPVGLLLKSVAIP
jgi:MoxR-like ATPase